MTHQPGHHGPGQHGPGHQPRYHGADQDLAARARGPRTRRQRWRIVVIAVVIAVVLAILIMHVTGAMPKGTGI